MTAQPFIEDITAFTRFFAGRLARLERTITADRYNLVEARVLYQLILLQPCTAKKLTDATGVHKSHISRVLRVLQEDGVVGLQADNIDRRQSFIQLTEHGMQEALRRTQAMEEEMKRWLEKLSTPEQQELVNHMKAICKLLA